jgi:hypothetical protein
MTNQHVTSFTSTTYLKSSEPMQKDYQTAFASLQSKYGASGMAPVQPTGTQSRSGRHSKSHASKKLSSTFPVTSRPQLYSSSSTPSRDWESALANLQTSYGFGGAAPAHRVFSSRRSSKWNRWSWTRSPYSLFRTFRPVNLWINKSFRNRRPSQSHKFSSVLFLRRFNPLR